MSTSRYTIHELFDINDNRHWKLHWFEQLTWNQLTTEPLLEALFVPLIRTDLNLDANPPELLDNDSYDFSQAKKIDVGGGQLSMLHIGLMLFQGRPVKRPRYQRKIFNLFIGEDTTEVLPVKHGHRLAPRKRKIYDIPYSQYQLGGTNDYVRCLHVNVPPGRRDKITKLIIPGAELIRCFFGNSSELFHQVLTNGLAGSPNRVFDPSKTILPGNSEGKTPFLQLSPYVKKKDAPIVARFVFDPYALGYARYIYISAQKNAKRPYRGRGSEPQGYVPEVRLPYVNKQTRLVVHGKEIVSGTHKYFLVYYIESDSAPFPFDYFEFGQDGSNEIHVVTDPNLPDAGRSVRVDGEEEEEVLTVNDEAEEFIIRTDKEPSATKEQVEELLWADKFPDLNKKNWRELDRSGSRTQPPRREPKFIQGHDDTEELSTAPRGSGVNKVTPLSLMFDFDGEGEENMEEIPVDEPVEDGKPKEPKTRRTTDHGEALPASYELFKKLIAMLNEVLPEKMQCAFVRVPRTGEEKTFGRPLATLFPTEWQGQRLPWSMVTRGGQRRERHLAAARGVCHGDRYFYLMEIEPPELNTEKESEARCRGRKPRKPRTYTMLSINYSERQGFADISSESLREVLAYCARNKGSWLKKKQLEALGRYKFKHASKFEKAFVARIIEYLLEAGLLTLEKAEVAEVIQRLKLAKADEPSQAGEQAQNDKQPQTTESAENTALSEDGESSRPPVVDEQTQADQPTVIEVSSEASESSETNEPLESPESSAVVTSDAETSYEESLVGV